MLYIEIVISDPATLPEITTAAIFDVKLNAKGCFAVVQKLDPLTPLEVTGGVDIKIIRLKQVASKVAGSPCRKSIVDWEMLFKSPKYPPEDFNTRFQNSVCLSTRIVDPFHTGKFALDYINALLIKKGRKAVIFKGFVLTADSSMNFESQSKKQASMLNNFFEIETVKIRKKALKNEVVFPNGYELQKDVAVTLSKPVDIMLFEAMVATAMRSEFDRRMGATNQKDQPKVPQPPRSALGIGSKPHWVGRCPGQDVRKCSRAMRNLQNCFGIVAAKTKNPSFEVEYTVQANGTIDSNKVKVTANGFNDDEIPKVCVSTTLSEYLYDPPKSGRPKTQSFRFSKKN